MYKVYCLLLVIIESCVINRTHHCDYKNKNQVGMSGQIQVMIDKRVYYADPCKHKSHDWN